MSEKNSPQIVVHLLNQFFEQMSNCIEKEGGLVNKYIGDAILAVFGAPIELKNHADAAIRAAFAMLEERDRLNKRLESQGYPVIRSGIGIHSGEVLAGNIGSQKRMEYTVIGDVVNVAARVEKLCKHTRRDLLITEATIKKLIENYDLKALSKASVRGKSESIVLYSN
ncbi:Adenylate cyclase 1 [subsurface metagenome]